MIKEMSDADYFADPALDQTSLKLFEKSPAKMMAALDNPVEKDDYTLGSLIHAYVLGTDTSQYVVKADGRTKAGKETNRNSLENGLTLVSADDMTLAEYMGNVTKPYFERIPGIPEQAIFETLNGVACKGKYDWLPNNPDNDGVLRIRDYKTIGADATEFPYHAWKYGYHVQAAFYMSLLRANGYHGFLGFEFVVQEKTAPYDYMVYRLDEGSPEIELANKRIDRALQRYKSYLVPNAKDSRQLMRIAGYAKAPRNLEFTDWQLGQEDARVESFGA